MSSQIASTDLRGVTTYDFGDSRPAEWPVGAYVPESVYRDMEARWRMQFDMHSEDSAALADALLHIAELEAFLNLCYEEKMLPTSDDLDALKVPVSFSDSFTSETKEAPTKPANSIHVGSDMHRSGAELKIDPNADEAHFKQPSTAETIAEPK